MEFREVEVVFEQAEMSLSRARYSSARRATRRGGGFRPRRVPYVPSRPAVPPRPHGAWVGTALEILHARAEQFSQHRRGITTSCTHHTSSPTQHHAVAETLTEAVGSLRTMRLPARSRRRRFVRCGASASAIAPLAADAIGAEAQFLQCLQVLRGRDCDRRAIRQQVARHVEVRRLHMWARGRSPRRRSPRRHWTTGSASASPRRA